MFALRLMVLLVVATALSGCITTSTRQYSGEADSSAAIQKSTSDAGDSYVFPEAILFDLGKAELKPEVLPALESIATEISASTDEVLIVGHTDDVGDYDRNITLSEERASAVGAFFEGNGVAPARITTMGLGMEFPAVENDTPENRQKNRRVEVHVLKQGNKESYLSKYQKKFEQMLGVKAEKDKVDEAVVASKMNTTVTWREGYRQSTDDCVSLFVFTQCMWVTYPLRITGKVKEFDNNRGQYLIAVSNVALEEPSHVSYKYLQFKDVAMQRIRGMVGKVKYVEYQKLSES